MEPQPAALVMIASKPPLSQRLDIAPGKLLRIRAQPGVQVERAAASLPAGIETRQPFLRSTRTVASFNRAKATLAMQPARNATRYRCSPWAGRSSPIWLKKNGGSAEGASWINPPSLPSMPMEPMPRARSFKPLASKR